MAKQGEKRNKIWEEQKNGEFSGPKKTGASWLGSKRKEREGIWVGASTNFFFLVCFNSLSLFPLTDDPYFLD